MKKLLALSLIVFALLACEKDEDPSIASEVVGTFNNIEGSGYIIGDGVWEFLEDIDADASDNIKITEVSNNSVLLDFGDGEFIEVSNLTKATNGIFGKILFQNRQMFGEIVEVTGYQEWEIEDEGYSFMFDNDIISTSFIMDEILLIDVQAIKKQ